MAVVVALIDKLHAASQDLLAIARAVAAEPPDVRARIGAAIRTLRQVPRGRLLTKTTRSWIARSRREWGRAEVTPPCDRTRAAFLEAVPVGKGAPCLEQDVDGTCRSLVPRL